MILSFNSYIKESMKDVNNFFIWDDGSEHEYESKFSNVKTGSKYDVLKKSKNGVYSHIEFKTHELMKKRSDLFCKVLKNSYDSVLMEKLDTKRFNYQIHKTNKEQFKLYDIDDIIFNIFYYKRRITKQIVDKYYDLNIQLENFDFFVQDFVRIKLAIYEYFSTIPNFLIKDRIELDLHTLNFGFIKGTNKIRCFDPIVIREYEKNHYI